MKSKNNKTRTYIMFMLPLCFISALAISFVFYINMPPSPEQQAYVPIIDDTNTNNLGQTENLPAPPETASIYKKNFYTFLITGIDQEGQNTDTIMVASFDTDNNKLNIVSIPRDSQVDVQRNPQKINGAYSQGGIKQLEKELQSLLGFSPHYHIVLNLEAFEELVDAIDGVEFDVPQDMYKSDPSQNLYINLQKGAQTLDGNKAMQFVRYRGYANADIGRMQAQQQFLIALADKLLSFSNLVKLNELIAIFTEHIETNLSLREIQWFARQAMSLDPDTDINVHTLPYEGFGNYRGSSYVYLAEKELLTLINTTINPYTFEITYHYVQIIRLED